MKFWIKPAVAILPALLLVGCGTSGEVENASDSGVSSSASADGSASSASTSGVSATPSFQGNALDNPNSLLAKRVIYFDFDQSEVRADVRAVIQAHAEYLSNNAGVSITLEGHADELGTREYNIALGERRAKAVERMLTVQGVAASQVRVVSYGEERPAALGHDEDARALNRRVEFIYKR
jgi:peptidoglycan-associated lipoprotein